MKILGDIPKRLVCIILFLIINPFCFSQNVDDFLALITRDEEYPFPEEDLITLSLLENRVSRNLSENIKQIETLTFLSQTDINVIKSFEAIELIPADKLSNNGKLFLELLLSFKKISSPVDVYFKQFYNYKNDYQYRWIGRFEKNGKTIGFLTERDPFETYMFDHYSAYLDFPSKWGQFYLGDMQITNGFGLLLWRSVPVNKGLNSFGQLSRLGNGLKPYKSSHENWGIRGVGSSIKTDWGSIQFVGGNTKRDGTINHDHTIIYNHTGTHISDNEIIRKESIREKTAIFNWENQFKRIFVGANIITTKSIENNLNVTENSHSFYFKTTFSTIESFGEFASGYGGTQATVYGLKIPLKHVKYIAVRRNISPFYRSLRSNPMSEWSSVQEGERGFFQSLLIRFNKNYFTIYHDLFEKQINDSFNNFPEAGNEIGAQFERRNKNLLFRLKFKTDNKNNSNTSFSQNTLEPNNVITRYQSTLYYYFPNGIKSKSQLNVTQSDDDQGYGINYQLSRQILNVHYLFDWTVSFVPNFQSRIYFWDVNLPGEMRTRMVSYDGHHLGIRLIYKKGTIRVGVRIASVWKHLKFLAKPEMSNGVLFESYF